MTTSKAGGFSRRNKIYFGSKELSFSKSISFGKDSVDTYAIELADFNKDGLIDIVAANYLNPNTVFINSEGKSFERINLMNDSYKTYDVALGDINKDGWIDIAFANSDDFNVFLINIIKRKKKK